MSESVRSKYKKDYSVAVNEYEAAVKGYKKALQEHKKKFSQYYKLRTDYEKILNAIGQDRYKELADGKATTPANAKELKLIEMTVQYSDKLRDCADGHYGVLLAEDQEATLKPAKKLKDTTMTKVEKARETLEAYIETKSKLKKEDPAKYKEWKKMLREGLFAG